MFELVPATEEISSLQKYFLGWIQWEQRLALEGGKKKINKSLSDPPQN